MKLLPLLVAAGLLAPCLTQTAEAGRRDRIVIARSCHAPVYRSLHRTSYAYSRYYAPVRHRPLVGVSVNLGRSPGYLYPGYRYGWGCPGYYRPGFGFGIGF